MSEDSDRYKSSSEYDYRVNKFRDADKYFRSRKSHGSRPKVLPTDYSHVIDLRNLSNNESCPDSDRVVDVASRVNGEWVWNVPHGFNRNWTFSESKSDYSRNLKPNQMKAYVPDSHAECGYNSAKIYAIQDLPGFFVVSRALSYEQQLSWALRCFTEFADADYNNLINLHFTLPEAGLADPPDPPRTREDLKELFFKAYDQRGVSPASLGDLKGLRWASLGFLYDWTLREYSEARRAPMPARLRFASELVQPLVAHGLIAPIESEAGIVNFYPWGSKMGAHVDDAEAAVECPIVGMSLGSSAVFTIGSGSRADNPVSLFLRSGDIVIQDGSARLAFHAVPRIIEHSLPRRPLQQAAERLLAAVDESPAPLTAAQPGSAPASEGDSAAPASPLPAADVEDFQAVVAYLRPSLAARGLSLAQALGFLLELLDEYRVNFNVRQVQDERYGKPSEVRAKYPLDTVLSGLYASNSRTAEAATERDHR